MSDEIRELHCVALMRDLPDEGLTKGQTGAVVLVHDGGKALEVEFPTGDRESIVATVMPADVLKLKGLDYTAAAG